MTKTSSIRLKENGKSDESLGKKASIIIVLLVIVVAILVAGFVVPYVLDIFGILDY